MLTDLRVVEGSAFVAAPLGGLTLARLGADVIQDVDAIGLSMHNGAHLTLAPAVVAALQHVGLTTPVIVGGIVPAVDVPELGRVGVVAVLGPGASSQEIVATVERACARHAVGRSEDADTREECRAGETA